MVVICRLHIVFHSRLCDPVLCSLEAKSFLSTSDVISLLIIFITIVSIRRHLWRGSIVSDICFEVIVSLLRLVGFATCCSRASFVIPSLGNRRSEAYFSLTVDHLQHIKHKNMTI